MSRAGLLRLYRWLALVFALPLLAVIGSGLLLALEPIAHQAALRPGTLTADRVDGLLARHDPLGQAWFIAFKPYGDRLLIGAPAPQPPLAVDLATGEPSRGGVFLSDAYLAAKRLHNSLLLDLRPLVLASTYAMLVLIVLAAAVGLPRFRERLAGWPKAVAWVLLPLLAASPLTGLLIAHGITFAPVPQPSLGQPVPLREAVRIVHGAGHDLSSLVWLKAQRGQVRARFVEGNAWRIYTVSADGVAPLPQSWPNALHAGQVAGYWSGAANIAAALGLLTLLGTGLLAWMRTAPARRAAAEAGGAVGIQARP